MVTREMIALLEFFKLEIWIFPCLILLICFINDIIKNSKKRFPPGPIGLPIVGYLPFLTKNVHLKLTELSKKYGEVFSLRLGSKLVIVLNGTDSIREAFGKSEFLGRPPNNPFYILTNKSPFVNCNLEVWQEQRRFVIQALKNHGLGRSKITSHIKEEISHFLKMLQSHSGKPIDLTTYSIPSISNNMSLLIFGHRYDYDHPERKVLDERIDKVSKIIAQTSIYTFLPWIRFVPFIKKLLKHEEAFKVAEKSDDFFKKEMEKHIENLDPTDIKDFIDSYLIEMKSRKERNSKTSFTYDSLIGNISNLFVVGSESAQTTLSWCTYIMAAFPEVQGKIQKEIADVLEGRDFDVHDQKSMPYTYAVILEIMRWKTITPLNILRYTTADTNVSGYHIPKNTIVLANFWAVHFNPNYWKNPEDFIPERFLTEDKKSIVKSIHFMPFSVGKRACPGESMLYMEIFFYLVSILQKFNIKMPPGVELTFEAEIYTTYKLKHHRLCFIPRY